MVITMDIAAHFICIEFIAYGSLKGTVAFCLILTIEGFKQANITQRYHYDSCLCCINTSADKVQFLLIALC